VGAKVAANHEGFWIVDVVRERAEAQGVFDIMRQTAALDGPETDHVVEEEKGSSGKLILESTKERFYQIPTAGPVWPAGVEQNKVIRALPLAAAIRDGRYFLAPQLNATELMTELEMWPDSRYDDQVDALAHAHNHLAPLTQGLVGSGWTPGQ
jgi:predicted phage terminase large subunit-like protein